MTLFVQASLDFQIYMYKRRKFNVIIRVLPGALLIPFIFHLFLPFEVFFLDGYTLFKFRNPFCKGREVGLFMYTLGFSLVKETGKGTEIKVWQIRWIRELNFLFLFQKS